MVLAAGARCTLSTMSLPSHDILKSITRSIEHESRPDSRTASRRRGRGCLQEDSEQLNQVKVSVAARTVLWGVHIDAVVAALRAGRILALERVARLPRLDLVLFVEALAARGSGLPICAISILRASAHGLEKRGRKRLWRD